MREAGRIAAAIEVLEARAADRAEDAGALSRALAAWGRRARFAGSKDRRAVADLAFDATRRRASRAAMMASDAPRARILAGLAVDGRGVEEIAELCAGGDRAPEPLDDAERARLVGVLDGSAAAALAARPPWVRSDWPEQLWSALRGAGSDAAAEADAMAIAERGAADVRVNVARADVASSRAALEAAGIVCAPSPLSPIGLRCDGAPNLSHLEIFERGWIEPQSAASQAVALLAAALTDRFGGAILDACCGGGGKALAIAAARPDARVDAFDVDRARTSDLVPRARRAGAAVGLLDRAPDRGRYDVVLVDAPCSGSGAWARAPDAKWALRAARLADLCAAQQDAAARGRAALRAGGALVYATCSVLETENAAAARAIAAASGLQPLDLGDAWRAAGLAGAPPPADAAGGLRLSPSVWRSDGFYIAAFA